MAIIQGLERQRQEDPEDWLASLPESVRSRLGKCHSLRFKAEKEDPLVSTHVHTGKK